MFSSLKKKFLIMCNCEYVMCDQLVGSIDCRFVEKIEDARSGFIIRINHL